MSKQLYELIWIAHCMEFEFVLMDFRVFASIDEANHYGKQKMYEWNDGLLAEEKALDGYCFSYMGALPVNEIDGYPIVLLDKGSNTHEAEGHSAGQLHVS